MTRPSAALVGLGLLLACAACKKSGYEDLPDGGLGTTCAGSAECGAPYVCIAGLCAPPGQVMAGRPCWATRDCVPGLFCSPAGVCAQGGAGGTGDACATDAQCAAGLRCEHDGFAGACAVSGAGEPGAACMAQDDCLAGLYCGAAATCQPLAVAFPPFAGVDCAPAEPPFSVHFTASSSRPRPCSTICRPTKFSGRRMGLQRGRGCGSNCIDRSMYTIMRLRCI